MAAPEEATGAGAGKVESWEEQVEQLACLQADTVARRELAARAAAAWAEGGWAGGQMAGAVWAEAVRVEVAREQVAREGRAAAAAVRGAGRPAREAAAQAVVVTVGVARAEVAAEVVARAEAATEAEALDMVQLEEGEVGERMAVLEATVEWPLAREVGAWEVVASAAVA